MLRQGQYLVRAFILAFIKEENYAFNSDVQFGQRVALMEMVLMQCGHSLVVGSAGAGAFFMLLADLTMRKITKAMIRKSTTD